MSTTTPPRPTRAPRQRQAPGAGAAKGAAPQADATQAAEPKLDKKKKIIAAVLVVAIAVAAYYFLAMKPGAEPAEEPAPEPGEVLVLDAISLNLEGDHYLRIGVALQLVAHEDGGGGHGGGSSGPDGSKAKDIVISTLSGRNVQELSNPTTRDEVKHELKEKIVHAYHEEVMDIYFTEFVTQ